MTFKKVFRRDGLKVRLFRLMWNTGIVGDGRGYSSKLSLALVPKLLHWSTDYLSWRFALFGVEVHHKRSYGGRFA